MPIMKRADIEHLARLSRLRLTEDELSHFETELSSIMSYVSEVSGIADDEGLLKPQIGVVHNVFRKDEITNQPDDFTKDIIAEMPHAEGRMMSVKKILNTDN